MAQETLTVQNVARTGAEVNLQSVTALDGFKFRNDGKTVMIVTEVNAADCEFTVTPTKTVDGLSASSRTVDVAASETWVLGPWSPEIYNDSDGYIEFTVEADEASAVAVVSIG